MSEFTPAFWVLQLGFDIAATLFIVRTLLKNREIELNPPEQRMDALIDVVQKRVGEWEKVANQNRSRAEQQLRALAKICEQANQTLSRARLYNGSLVPSEEEKELRALSCEKTDEKIPSVEQLQKAQKRVQNEMALSLKSILSHQLA